MTSINKLNDIVDNGLCIGCGLCQSIAGKKNIEATIAIATTINVPCKVSLPVGQVTLKASCLTS